MYQSITIGDAVLGTGQPVFIIAEAGVNHNGDIEIAKRLIHAAKNIGADCVKFQTFKAERVITKEAPKAEYQLKTTSPKESQFEMLRKLEMSFESHKVLFDICNEIGIMFLSTPYNHEDVDFLDNLGVFAYKLASIHIAEPQFLQYVASKGKPMIVSTGMATLAEVDEAVRAIRSTGNEQLILLQCTTNYPSNIEDANIRAMQTMRNAFHVLVGYSDHTLNDTACIVSVALGACIIEKHFTLDKSLPGPDHSASADPAEFSQLIQHIRETEIVLGSNRKEPCKAEKTNIQGMRRSIVSKRDILKGQVITADMLTFKRPATGLPPASLSEAIGRVATKDIEANQILTWDMCGERI